jgi:hypothetical protein
MARTGAAVALAVICLGTAASARDIVHLEGGQVLEGEVTRETADAIWLKSADSTMRIKRSRVMEIERDKPLSPWQIKLRAKRKKEARKRAEAAKVAAEKAKVEKKAGDTKKDSEKAERLLEDLASADADTRREAAALLEREGSKAVPALTTKGLRHKNSFAREYSARILGKLQARQSVRAMIIAIRSAVPAKDKIRPWQRSFVRALRTSLSATTGQNFGVSFYGTHQGKVAEKYVTWWDGEDPSGGGDGGAKPKKGACIEWDTLQVGEEPVEAEEDDPELEKKLWDARRIGSERNSYSPPKAFVDPFGDARGKK